VANPRKTQKPPKKPDPQAQAYMFFNISAEVSYVDQVPPKGELPNFKREKVAILYRGSSRGIVGKELAHIQARITAEFLNEYAGTLAKITLVIPSVTKVVFLTFVPLGVFTDAEFSAGISFDTQPVSPKAEPEKKE
jgi:hypothetical protein